MAKLLSIARWPEDDQEYPEFPVEFVLAIAASGEGDDMRSADWFTCQMTLSIQREVDGSKEPLSQNTANILRRDLSRLVSDLKALILQQSMDHLTFVPVTPSFELWLSRLSDEQYRAIIWRDMASEFSGASGIAYQGLRFMTNRARLMGFARSLEADLKKVD